MVQVNFDGGPAYTGSEADLLTITGGAPGETPAAKADAPAPIPKWSLPVTWPLIAAVGLGIIAVVLIVAVALPAGGNV